MESGLGSMLCNTVIAVLQTEALSVRPGYVPHELNFKTLFQFLIK
uniref:Uncharacterized protein n=1 Tax=Anguilla anguilla TaxID=7936 RepID=A0A0E9REY7_ANGAN